MAAPVHIPRGHKPIGNYEMTPFGRFLAGVGIGVGIIVVVRFGPRLLTRVFIRRAGGFFARWLTKKLFQNATVGPLPGTLLGDSATFRMRMFAIVNVGLWVTGIWSYLMKAGEFEGYDALDYVIDLALDEGQKLFILEQKQNTKVTVSDDGAPIVTIVNGSGTAFISVGPAWRVDP